MVFTWAVGTDRLGDIYQAANTVPNIIFEIVAGGALASLVVPVVAAPLARADRAAVAATVSGLLTWVITLLVPVAIVVACAAGRIITLIAQHPTAVERAVGTDMLRIFAPQLPLYGVGIVLAGLLQAHRRFVWPVLAPLLSSVAVSTAYLLFAAVAGRSPRVDALGDDGLLILAGGTTAAVAVLTLCLVVPVRRLDLPPLRPTYRLGGVAGSVRRLAGAGAVTVGAQQACLALIVALAYRGPRGSLVLYTLAQTMFLLPWAVLAVPIATSVFPTLAERHATADEDGFRVTTATSLRAVVLASAFGAAVLVAVAPDAAVLLAALARERPDPAPLANAIVAFAPGLLGYGLFALLSRVLYARQVPGAAATATAIGWAVTAVAAVAVATARPPGERVAALAAGNSIGMLVLGGALLAVVYRRVGGAALAGLWRVAGAGLLAATVAVVAVTATRTITTPDRCGVMATVGHATLSAILAVVAFAGTAYAVDGRDLRPAAIGLLRRVRRGRVAAVRDGGGSGT